MASCGCSPDAYTEVLQRAALYSEHAVSDTTEVLRDMVTGTVIIRPHQQFGGGRQHTLHARRWAAAVSFRNTYW